MIGKICAISLLAAILSATLSELGFKNRKLIGILSSLLLFSLMKDAISDYISQITRLTNLSGVGDACTAAVKVVGLGYLFGITSEVCSELGENGVSKAVTIAGRLEILVVVLPYFKKTLELGLELLK